MDKMVMNSLYKKGISPKLDERYTSYKRMHVFSGGSLSIVLTDEESDIMIKLWKKEILRPWAMLTSEILTLVAGLSFFEIDIYNF